LRLESELLLLCSVEIDAVPGMLMEAIVVMLDINPDSEFRPGERAVEI
jgi:hypothetical protein